MDHKRVLELDKTIREALVDKLLEMGFAAGVYDGEEYTVRNSTDAAKIKAALGTVDIDWLIAYRNGRTYGHFMLVYGECGYDVVCDYTTNLDSVYDAIRPIIDKCEKEYDRG